MKSKASAQERSDFALQMVHGVGMVSFYNDSAQRSTT